MSTLQDLERRFENFCRKVQRDISELRVELRIAREQRASASASRIYDPLRSDIRHSGCNLSSPSELEELWN